MSSVQESADVLFKEYKVAEKKLKKLEKIHGTAIRLDIVGTKKKWRFADGFIIAL